LQFLLIFKWIDLVEILIFSTLFYAFSIWLRKDKQKNLLPTFYLMNIALITTNITCMHTIYNFLIHFWSVIVMLFVLIHQNTLQKNFIALKNLTPTKNKDENWFEDFMRSCLIAMNNKKEIITVIEGKDSFEYFINSSFTIKTAMNQELLNALINSPSFDNQKMVWISHNGILKAINSTWKIENDLLWAQDEYQNIEKWKQDAILFSSKMDSLIFKTNINKRSFDIIVHGKLIEDVAPNNAINIIDQFIKKLQLLNKETNENKFKATQHNNQQPLA
ncbi:MAG: hypothetical protein P4L22_02815, partial [Candidatus Babeliales bacterium]|nr:hypothetical protein [Candidatus Babeliales bacterium]